MSFVRKFYISDTHFLHDNILQLSNRPFASIEEHDEHLIQRWNAVVGQRNEVMQALSVPNAMTIGATAMTDDEYDFLATSHGSAVPPRGWIAIADALRRAIKREHPTAIVRSMSYDRGWLSVELDDSALGPAERYALGRLIQGFVTQSLSTCGRCGSHHGRDRGERRMVTCDECDRKTCDA